MARYKAYDLNQAKMIPLSYADQIVAGSFEHALNEIVEEHLDLTVFDQRHANDETGRPAYDPKVLLKVFADLGRLQIEHVEFSSIGDAAFAAPALSARQLMSTGAALGESMGVSVLADVQSDWGTRKLQPVPTLL